jgi:hypothetical protein
MSSANKCKTALFRAEIAPLIYSTASFGKIHIKVYVCLQKGKEYALIFWYNVYGKSDHSFD